MDRLEEYNIECMLINDNQAQEDELIKEYERNNMDRLISEQDALNAICKVCAVKVEPSECRYRKGLFGGCKEYEAIKAIPSAATKKCKDCKWWRDSDGAYRRGVKAESRCPINTVSVANGWGYCYMFEEQERSEE